MSENKKLVVVDLQYMFHRHKYRIKDFEEKKGTYMLSYNGQETARLYFTLKDLFAILEVANNDSADVVICMDSKSARKAENDDYKANRVGLENLDLAALQNIESVVRKSGLTVLKEDGFEADDIVASVVKHWADKYDAVYIFTPDADLCTLVKGNVRIYRYKSIYSKNNTFLAAHKMICEQNLSEVLSQEYKTYMPYNAVMLYKCTVGDTSDGIKGIKGFGPAAFKKLMIHSENIGIDFARMVDADYVDSILDMYKTQLGEGGVEQARESLSLVRSRTNENIESAVANADMKGVDLDEFRAACAPFGIVSL